MGDAKKHNRNIPAEQRADFFFGLDLIDTSKVLVGFGRLQIRP